MWKCPVFSNFCCCCPLKVIITINDYIFDNIVTISVNISVINILILIIDNHMKVGAIMIGVIYLILGLTGGLFFTIFGSGWLDPEDFEWHVWDMGMVKISDGQVNNSKHAKIRTSIESSQLNFPQYRFTKLSNLMVTYDWFKTVCAVAAALSFLMAAIGSAT